MMDFSKDPRVLAAQIGQMAATLQMVGAKLKIGYDENGFYIKILIPCSEEEAKNIYETIDKIFKGEYP